MNPAPFVIFDVKGRRRFTRAGEERGGGRRRFARPLANKST